MANGDKTEKRERHGWSNFISTEHGDARGSRSRGGAAVETESAIIMPVQLPLHHLPLQAAEIQARFTTVEFRFAREGHGQVGRAS